MRRFGSIIAAAVLSLAGAAAAADRAGVVERLKGEAYQTTAGTQSYLAVGTPIFADDVLATGPYARVEVRFADGSALTLGENAEIVVDEFVYAPGDPDNRQTLEMVRGVFRFATGAIGAGGADNFGFKTPVATIGVRGTEFVGGELTVGMPVGVPHYGFQLRDGAIDVTSPAGTVTLDAPGEGTFLPIGRAAAPTPVRQWTPAEAEEADRALAF